MWALQKIKQKRRGSWAAAFLLGCLLSVSTPLSVSAVPAFNPIPPPPPAPGSYAFVASKTQPAPTTAATISTPANGSSFTDSPITVSGLCTTGLLVEIYDNGVLVGAIDC